MSSYFNAIFCVSYAGRSQKFTKVSQLFMLRCTKLKNESANLVI